MNETNEINWYLDLIEPAIGYKILVNSRDELLRSVHKLYDMGIRWWWRVILSDFDIDCDTYNLPLYLVIKDNKLTHTNDSNLVKNLIDLSL